MLRFGEDDVDHCGTFASFDSDIGATTAVGQNRQLKTGSGAGELRYLAGVRLCMLQGRRGREWRCEATLGQRLPTVDPPAVELFFCPTRTSSP